MAQIGALIDKAEATYTEGLNDYQSGNLEQAKQEFDRSLSVLLESSFNVRDNARLSQEFDMLADNINRVERASLDEGNSLSEHQYVPAPIESFAGLTFPVNPAVARRVEQEMHSVHSDIPLISNQYVSGVIAYMQQHARGYIDSILRRLGRYQPMMSAALRKEGAPQDLIYLGASESAFNPHAVSRKGAAGIWQFMRGTGALYGLKENRWVDDREDPFKSTQAAAKHLMDLYHMFGDWYLAMAAYDSGPLTVQRAIQNTGYADFWTLRKLHALPPETENYVPIFLATALIAKDPQAYGFGVQTDSPLQVDRVPVSVPTDLRLIAGLIDHPADQLAKLNPGLREWATPPGDPGFVLNLPVGTGQLFEKRIASVPPADRLAWRACQVQPGDTVAGVARRYHMTTLALAEANGLAPSAPLDGVSHLLIPLRREQPRRVVMASGHWVRRRTYYRIRRGDNLDLIADRFDVTTYQIRRWNGMRGSRLIAGKRLLIYRLFPLRRKAQRRSMYRRAAASGPAAGRLIYYRIQRGDTLDLIAGRFNVTAYQIRRWNGMRGSRLVAGKRLLIYRSIHVEHHVAPQPTAQRNASALHSAKNLKPSGVVASTLSPAP
ncbi:MAG TPA: LysM peptidoglycan-binding domain-containing protein [Terriglobia bacterium]|nr:LysM peptidoglycan-binding domain-containing protein [Terriglobia bacterium]